MDVGQILQSRLGIHPAREPHDGIFHPAGSPYTVKKRWKFQGADGGRYEVAVSGPKLLARLLRRAPTEYWVTLSIAWSRSRPAGGGFVMHGTDGWLGSCPTYEEACSRAHGFIEQKQRAAQ